MSGRKLSEYQQKPWMDQIAKNRKYLNPPKGEKNGNARLTEKSVLSIRECQAKGRVSACNYYGISERHWYHIRARQKWKHI